MAGKIELVEDNEYYTASRLPVDLIPEHYKLTLSPNLEEFTFLGNVIIEFNPTKTVSEIILNAIDLEIKGGFVTQVNGEQIALKKIIQNTENQTMALKFDQENFLAKSLTLDFVGFLNDKMKGFYRTSLTAGDKNVIAGTTQFEACDARRAFPCFDEPNLKASFEVTLIYDSEVLVVKDKSYKQIALSNGEIISEEKTNDGKTITKFEKSPKMSTYLLAFVVGPFGYLESKTKYNCRVRVYTRPGVEQQGSFALDLACKSLEFFEDYFDIKYPLTKLDLVAIPDFIYGAMENWGLVTYRESTLLYDPATTSTANKQYIAMVVAHELAHQWFGNLVTMDWWNDLWLNEGFATFMQYLCADTIHPEWNLWKQFVSDVWSGAMDKDSLHNSHPINVPVNKACEIDDIFDEISYRKGSSIIRMLYDYIGNDDFKVGLSSYLKKFSYGNAVTNDLWDSLGRATKFPVTQIADIMSGWTDKMGYPWIKVDIESEDSSDDMTITLEQQRFTANGKLNELEENQKWMVPISVKSGSEDVKQMSLLFVDKKTSIVIPKQKDHWLKLNVDTIGFYRTAYSQRLLDRLTRVIEHDFERISKDINVKHSLSAVERIGIQNDYFALCQAGHIPTFDLMKLVASFENETDYSVWKSIDNTISWLCNVLRDTQLATTFHSFVRQLYKKIYHRSMDQAHGGDLHTNSMLQSLIMKRLVLLEDKDVVAHAKKMYRDQFGEKSSPIPVDLKGPVYVALSRFGSDSDYDELFTLRRKEDSLEEKNRIAAALASAVEPKRLKRFVDLVLTDEVRNQDKGIVMMPMGGSNPDFAWETFKEHHEYFKQIYEGTRMCSNLIKFMSQYFTTEERAQEVENFFKANKFVGAERNIEQSLETIRLNAAWRLRIENENHAEIEQFLVRFSKQH